MAEFYLRNGDVWLRSQRGSSYGRTELMDERRVGGPHDMLGVFYVDTHDANGGICLKRGVKAVVEAAFTRHQSAIHGSMLPGELKAEFLKNGVAVYFPVMQETLDLLNYLDDRQVPFPVVMEMLDKIQVNNPNHPVLSQQAQDYRNLHQSDLDAKARPSNTAPDISDIPPASAQAVASGPAARGFMGRGRF